MDENRGRLNFRRIVPIARKEFLHVVRDRRSLVVVILAPIVMLLLYGYAVTFDIRKIDLSVVDEDHSSLSRELVRKFTASGYFALSLPSGGDMRRSVDAMRVNKVRVIMDIPPGFARDLKKSRQVAVQVIADGSDSNTASVALGYLRTIIADFSQGVTVQAVRRRGFDPKKVPAVTPEPRIWYNPDLRSTNFIVPGLIAIIMMLIAALLTSLTIVREKERGTFEQLISTPVKPLELMAGKLIPYILIGLVDVALIVVVGIAWFHVPFRGNVFTLFLFSLLFLFCSLGLGLFVSSLASSQQEAVIGTSMVTMLPSILLSGFVFPIESMPWIVRLFTYFVPARYFLTALRSIFLKADVSVITLSRDIIFLLLFGALFLVVSALRFRKTLG